MMETSWIQSLVLSILAILVSAWVWCAANWLWFAPRRNERLLRRQGLLGRPYRFFCGDLKESWRMLEETMSRPISLSDNIVPRLIPFLHRTIETYGKNCFIWLGQTPTILITNPEHIKEILSKLGDYPKPSGNPLAKLLVQGLGTYEVEKWTIHRKIINPAFHQDKLKLMLPAFHSSTDEMVRKWEELVPAGGGPCEIDVWPDLQVLTRDIISRTAFGSSFEEGRRIFELQLEQLRLMTQVSRSVYVPGWRHVPTKINRRMKNIWNEVHMLVRDIINKNESVLRERGADDLLGMLLMSNMKERVGCGDKGFSMSINDVIEECKFFYFAGQETTSTLLAWTMLMLSIHRTWQSRARNEVLRVFGDRKPDFDTLSQLKMVTMILYEVLRLYPPGIELTRKPPKQTKIGDLIIPAGAQLLMPIILLHKDPDLWGDDAGEFNPERFSEGISKAASRNNQAPYFPFGWGPRICIGQNFALMEAKIVLAMILSRFSFEISPNYSHAPITIITLQPQHGMQLILRRL